MLIAVLCLLGVFYDVLFGEVSHLFLVCPYLSIHLFIYLSIHPSIYLTIDLSIYPPTNMYNRMCMIVKLYIYIYIYIYIYTPLQLPLSLRVTVTLSSFNVFCFYFWQTKELSTPRNNPIPEVRLLSQLPVT